MLLGKGAPRSAAIGCPQGHRAISHLPHIAMAPKAGLSIPDCTGRGCVGGRNMEKHQTSIPTAGKGLVPAKGELSHGAQPAPRSQISCQPGQIAGAQDGWRTRQPHSKLVVSMRWMGRGSACPCWGEGNSCLPAARGERGRWALLSLKKAKVWAGSAWCASPETHGHRRRDHTQGQGPLHQHQETHGEPGPEELELHSLSHQSSWHTSQS